MILSASDTAIESFEFLLGKFQLKNLVIDNFKGFTQNYSKQYFKKNHPILIKKAKI